MSVKHFSKAREAIDFINNLSEADKDNVCLLSDYEFIGQDINGLEVIQQVKIKRAILVTSWYVNASLRSDAIKNMVKILPKDLVHIVPIKIVQEEVQGEPRQVHMVFVDDDRNFTQTLIANYYSHLITESYSNPLEFLEKSDMYTKDTQIILDNYYYTLDGSPYDIDGVTLAEKLHDKGFNNLILLSGELFDVPDYLKIILKTDFNTIAKLNTI